MATWKFTDDYAAKYPALEASILSLLAFSDHSLDGTAFTGTLDVEASGAALGTLGLLLDMKSIAVSGTVSDDGSTLAVSLSSTDGDAFKKGVAAGIPLVGGSVTQAAWMTVDTTCMATDTADGGPTADAITLHVTLAVGSSTVTIACGVPMNGGFFSLTGDFQNVGIGLDDLNFLMGSLASGNAWFPTEKLGPYTQGSPAFELLSMSLTAFIPPGEAFTVSITSVTVEVGIVRLPLMPPKLYMDPLAVVVTVTDPTGKAAAHWGLEGAMKLCNHANPGPGGLSAPDFEFDFAMGFPDETDPNFTVSGALESPSSQPKPVNVMLQDLIGPSIDIGLADDLTVTVFEFDTTADTSTGTVTDFSTTVAMAGSFGLFEKLTLESFSVSVVYAGD